MSSLPNSRAITALLQPLMGTPGGGTVTAKALTGTVDLPPFGVLLPIVNGGIMEEAGVFVQKNPATENGNWSVTTAGTPIQVASLLGGPIVNRANLQYRWDPPMAGLDPLALGTVSGGMAADGFGALKQVRQYRNMSPADLKELFAAQISNCPAAALAWEATQPLDGPIPSVQMGTARMAKGKKRYRHMWTLFLITTRADNDARRRVEGDRLRDTVVELITEQQEARGLPVSDSFLEINEARYLTSSPTAFVDIVRFSTTFAMTRIDPRTFGPWLTTRFLAQTEPIPQPEPQPPIPELVLAAPLIDMV
jgi:hypothetical protein